jgi:hypothetical protein
LGAVEWALAYQEHPKCETPADEAVLWRYMDFTRFVDLLASRTLWFSRVDRLGDPREGLLTESEFNRLSKRSPDPASYFEKSRSLNFVNCWQQTDHEFMAMWDLYGAGGCGIAIRSTIGSLKTVVASTWFPIYVSKVEYVDWTRHDGDTENLIGMYVRKADGYIHESEVRLIVGDTVPEPFPLLSEEAPQGAAIDCERIARDVLGALAGFFPSCDFATVDGRQLVLEALAERQYCERLRRTPCGGRVSIDCDVLIHEVVVGPKAESWILELARTVVKRCGLSVKVRPSELSTPRR